MFETILLIVASSGVVEFLKTLINIPPKGAKVTTYIIAILASIAYYTLMGYDDIFMSILRGIFAGFGATMVCCGADKFEKYCRRD